MTAETKTVAYETVAAEAESAVMAVKDPELRRIAFEKILVTLLERKMPGHGPSRDTEKSPRSSPIFKKLAQSATPKPQSGPKAYIEELIRDDFFKEERTIAHVRVELGNRGRHIALTSLSGPLQKLTLERRLRRRKVVGNGKGTKGTYAYSNW